MQPIDIDKHLKNHPEMYFGPEGASENGLVNIIETTVKLLGAEDVNNSNIDGLCCVTADLDWLCLDNEYGLNENNVFDRIWPFPEAGVNSARIEAVIRVYSSVLVSAKEGDITVH